jgi:hypothetical protein
MLPQQSFGQQLESARLRSARRPLNLPLPFHFALATGSDPGRILKCSGHSFASLTRTPRVEDQLYLTSTLRSLPSTACPKNRCAATAPAWEVSLRLLEVFDVVVDLPAVTIDAPSVLIPFGLSTAVMYFAGTDSPLEAVVTGFPRPGLQFAKSGHCGGDAKHVLFGTGNLLEMNQLVPDARHQESRTAVKSVWCNS